MPARRRSGRRRTGPPTDDVGAMSPAPGPGSPAAPGPPSPDDVPGCSETVGHVVVDVSGRMNPSSPFYRYVPAISIDGAPLAQLATGPTPISLPAGHHELTVGVGSDVTTRFHYGRAHIAVTVVPHRTTTVYYRAPRTSLSHGTIGFTPQEATDTLPAALLIGCAIAAMLIGVLATLF